MFLDEQLPHTTSPQLRQWCFGGVCESTWLSWKRYDTFLRIIVNSFLHRAQSLAVSSAFHVGLVFVKVDANCFALN